MSKSACSPATVGRPVRRTRVHRRGSTPCDVPACVDGVAGSRTITFVPQNREAEPLSILIRLCAGHTDAPYDVLPKLLPKLGEQVEATGPATYLGPEEKSS